MENKKSVSPGQFQDFVLNSDYWTSHIQPRIDKAQGFELEPGETQAGVVERVLRAALNSKDGFNMLLEVEDRHPLKFTPDNFEEPHGSQIARILAQRSEIRYALARVNGDRDARGRLESSESNSAQALRDTLWDMSIFKYRALSDCAAHFIEARVELADRYLKPDDARAKSQIEMTMTAAEHPWDS